MPTKPDMRPVSQQVLSGLKIGSVLIGVVIVFFVLLRFIPVPRIESFYWHWRHGTSIDVGAYRFPVPKQWYVDYISADDVLLVDLDTGDLITVRSSSGPNRSTVAVWEALISHPRRDSRLKVLGRKQLQVGGETIVCLEMSLDTKAIHLYPIECRLENGPEVTFQPKLSSAKDHAQVFYSLLQQVQKL